MDAYTLESTMELDDAKLLVDEIFEHVLKREPLPEEMNNARFNIVFWNSY